MKRVCCLILEFSLVLAAIPIVALTEGGYLWMVDAPSGVNVRNAKKNGKIITTLRKGTIILVCEEDRYWVGYRLDDGSIGYCYKEYLHIAHAEEIEAWEYRKKNGIKVTNMDAYAIGTIKEECSVYKTANGTVIGNFQAGDDVYIRQTGKYWYRIIYENRELGYVRSQFIMFSRPNIPAEGEVKIVCCDGFARVYEEPNSRSAKIGKIKNGHYAIVQDDSDEKYAFVCYDAEGNVGFVLKKYLRDL